MTDLEQQAREERPNMGWFDIAVDNKGNVWVLDYSSDWNAFAIEPHWEDNFEIDAPSHLAPGAYRWSNFLVGSWGDDDAIAIRGGDFTSLAFRAAQPGEGLPDIGPLELTEDGLSLRTPYDGDADDQGRSITVGGDVLATFEDSDAGEQLREFVIAALGMRTTNGLPESLRAIGMSRFAGGLPGSNAERDRETLENAARRIEAAAALSTPQRPERLDREAAGSLAKRCDEILSWRKTGIYEGTELAAFAARAGRVDDGSEPGPYRWAEGATIREALEACACATPQRRPERETVARIIDPTAWKVDSDGYMVEQVHSDDALAKTDAILALLALLPSEGAWRDIASAPRNGSYILAIVAPDRSRYLGNQAGRMFVIRHEGRSPSGYDLGWAVYPGFGGASDYDFTHWHPLPAALSEPQEQGKGE